MLKPHLILTAVCFLAAGCGSGSDPVPGMEFVADDALPLNERLLNGEGLEWNCDGVFDDADWAVRLRLEPNNTAVVTFATGEALMATWVLDFEPREISWDSDRDGQLDRMATLEAPILNLATDSFHNIRETFTRVTVSDRRVLKMTRAKRVDSVLLTGDLICSE